MGISNFDAGGNHAANHAMDLFSTLQCIDTPRCFILLKPVNKCQPEGLDVDFFMKITFHNLFFKKINSLNVIP